jgi:hypothetical protein
LRVLVFRGHVGGIDNNTLYALFLEPIMNPESGVARLIDGLINCAWEGAFKIIYEHTHLRRLREGLMFKLIGKDTDAPTLLMDIHADINLLTREIKFVNVIHGKSPFGGCCYLADTQYPIG